MKNKKTIMFFSSLLILIFHFWINIYERTNSLYEIETFIRKICFIGVDIFFFVSSYSISKTNIVDYKKFILTRLKKIYIPFIIFSIIASIYFKWDLKTTILTITGINLFIKGGGSFLWFIPAILIIYIVLPIYIKIYDKHKRITTIITIVLWLLFTVLISQYTTYNNIFILTNRIPIILIGFYISKYKIIDKLSKIKYMILMLILIILGLFLLYNFKNNNISFINDIYYLQAIPLTLGIVLLIDLIPTNKIINLLGSITLELYGVQMIFGYKITSVILNLIKNHLLTNIISILIIILMAISTHYIFKFINRK